MSVPLLDLKAQWAGLREEVLPALEEVFDSQMFVMGPRVQAFEADLAAYCQARHAIGVSSGSDAILLGLMAMGIGPGAAVLTTPFSFFATAGVVARVGATPVFSDIDPATYNLDPAGLDAGLERRPAALADLPVKALIPVHLYGQSADMDPLMATARARGWQVIEDGAQALGTDYPSSAGPVRTGTIGDLGCTSFFPSKNLGAAGDAGALFASDDTLAEHVRMLRVHGHGPNGTQPEIGGNFRIDVLQTVVLQIKLRHLDTWTRGRQRNAQRYHEMFTEAGLTGPSTDAAPIVLPVSRWHDQLPADRHAHIFNQFVIRAQRRDELLQHLRSCDIGCGVYYSLPFHLMGCFQYLGYRQGDFPHAERAANEVVALPVYPELTEEHQRAVVKAISSFYGA